MGKKSGPKQPSPAATAAAQSQANKEAIIASANVNRYGTQSPFGSVSWTDPNQDGVPMTQTTTLSPEMQRLFEQEMERGEALGGLAMNRIGQVSQDPFTLDGLPSMDVGTGQEVEQATYDRLQQLMAPGREEGRRALENRMAVMGLPVGGEAYSTEANRFERGIAEADLAAGLQAVQAGRAEQSRLFDQAQRARQQGISETALERTQPLNELAMLLGQSPGLTAPQAPQTAQYQAAAPDIAGMIQQNYNTKAQQQAGKKAGSSNLAGTAMMAKAYAACVPEGQEIDTPDGFKSIESIRVGDQVIGYSGKPVEVLIKHEYKENPEPARFAKVHFEDGSCLSVCDKHRVHGVRSEDLVSGDAVGGKVISSIDWFGGVIRSYDILTEDGGYRIADVPVNTMIGEMAGLTVKLAEAVNG